jgi:hypothetical protein
MPLAGRGRQEQAVDACTRCERTIPDEGVLCPHCSSWEPPQTTADEPAEALPPAGGGLGRRQLLVIAAAVIGGGVITLTALRGGGADPAPTPPVVDPALPAASVTTAVTGEPDEPATTAATWIDNGSMWLGSSRKGIALELAALNETPVWMRTVRPLLVVRCLARRTDVFVFTDSAIAMEARDGDHAVRLSVDGGPERAERWPDSSTHDALFAPEGQRLLGELSGARSLAFSYTPHNAAPVTARLNVAGLKDRLGSNARHCQP